MGFTAAHLFFEDLEPGREWESLGRTVTEADIVNFAGLSGDFNPIHVDHHFAAETPFRKPIAHGMLVFAIASGLGVNSPPVRTLAFIGVRDWHFRGILVKFKLETDVSDDELIAIAERSRIGSGADLMVANTVADAEVKAFVGPDDGRYEEIDREDLPDILMTMIEGEILERL